jgi:hypothetical protein
MIRRPPNLLVTTPESRTVPSSHLRSSVRSPSMSMASLRPSPGSSRCDGGVVFCDVYLKERLAVPWREILWVLRRLRPPRRLSPLPVPS